MPTQPAGYSGTPLAKKLGIKPSHSVLFVGAPGGWSIPDLPDDVAVDNRPKPTDASVASADVVIAFFGSADRMTSARSAIAKNLRSDSALWVAWPRKAAGHPSDISDQLVRETFLPMGIVDVKVAALDNDWSGLKFVWRLENRKK
ncbi:MAG: DUF3052 domain-containing protein [Acidimicrobiales bacterium]|jgi:hypothetical protein